MRKPKLGSPPIVLFRWSEFFLGSKFCLLLTRHCSQFCLATGVILLLTRHFCHFCFATAVILLLTRHFYHFLGPTALVLLLHRHFSQFCLATAVVLLLTFGSEDSRDLKVTYLLECRVTIRTIVLVLNITSVLKR